MNVKPELLKKNRLLWILSRVFNTQDCLLQLSQIEEMYGQVISLRSHFIHSFFFFFAGVDEYESFYEKSEMLV